MCGINNDAIQRCLLGETPPLTFKKALEISHGMEMAANNTRDIRKGNVCRRQWHCTKSGERLINRQGGWNVFGVEGHTMQMTANSKMLFAMHVTKRDI